MLDVVKKAMRLFDASQRKMLALLVVLMLIGSALEVVSVSMMVPLIGAMMSTDASAGGALGTLRSLIPADTQQGAVLFVAVVLIVVFVVKTVFLSFEYRLQYRFVYRSRFDMQRKMLHSFLSRPYEYYLSAQTGEILRVIKNDVVKAFDLVTLLLLIATELIVMVVLVVTIFVISPFMTVFLACTMGITMLCISKLLRPAMKRSGLRLNEVSAQTNRLLIESVHGIKEIKVGRRERFFEDNFSAIGAEECDIGRRQALYAVTPRLLIEMVCVCSMLAVIAVMSVRGASVDTLVPLLSAFAMAAVRLMPGANRIMSSLNKIAYSTASLDKVVENLDALGAFKSISIAIQDDKAQPMRFENELCFKDITYRYPDTQVDVLDRASFSVKRGSCVGIMGPSGAGKTTAVDIMLGLLEPQEGSILVDGVDMHGDLSSWLACVGYIPQAIFMLDDSIRANVAFGRPVDDERIWKALDEAQLAEFVRGLPEGLDSQVGERGVRISGGQRQRIGIARALYSDPEVLFFDEATSALDTKTEQGIMESVYGLYGKKTLIIIAHRVTTLERCDHIFQVDKGKITFIR